MTAIHDDDSFKDILFGTRHGGMSSAAVYFMRPARFRKYAQVEPAIVARASLITIAFFNTSRPEPANRGKAILVDVKEN
jgi:hypothetical protein